MFDIPFFGSLCLFVTEAYRGAAKLENSITSAYYSNPLLYKGEYSGSWEQFESFLFSLFDFGFSSKLYRNLLYRDSFCPRFPENKYLYSSFAFELK